ncbi:MAG: hypothetical protein JOY67_03125 [Hyphomicrobiales bacterium]|nr:hypothetical protein [Hyphomicrobiales bacterium]
MKTRPPDILVRPDVDGFGALDFFKAGRILEAAEPAKAKLKEELGARLDYARLGAPKVTINR